MSPVSKHHDEALVAAVRSRPAPLDRGENFLTHVLVESIALLQARLGTTAATRLARDTSAFIVEWVDDKLYEAAVQELERSRKRQANSVDPHLLGLRIGPEHPAVSCDERS